MSESIVISYINDSFTIDRSESYQLLVRLRESRNDLAVIDKQNELQLLLSWREGAIDERVNQLLHLSFEAKKFVIDHKNLLLVPVDCYETGQNDYYLNQLHADYRDYTLIANRLKALSVYSLYTINTEVLTTIQQNYAPNPLWSTADVLLFSLNHILRSEASFLALNVGEETVDFTYFKERQLIYHQTHTVSNADDFNYFLLSIIKQFAISIPETGIWLSGKISIHHPYFERLKKYTEALTFISPTKLVQGGYEHLEKEYDLLTLMGLTCVS